MTGIFISYRRDDAQGEARHLADDLEKRFHGQVFMDVTGIEPGRDFRKVIDSAVSSCDILIVVIGRDWLNATDAQGRRRLDDTKDFVRLETGVALTRDIPVIPVLVQGAAMPTSEQLPPDLEALAWRNAFELRHQRWAEDFDLLLRALQRIAPASQPQLAVPASRPPAPVPTPTPSRLGPMIGGAAAVLVLGIGGLVWWQSRGTEGNAVASGAPPIGTVAQAERTGDSSSAPQGGARPADAAPPVKKTEAPRADALAPKPEPKPKPDLKAQPRPAPGPHASAPAPSLAQPPVPPEPVAHTVARNFVLDGGEPGTQMSPKLELVAGFETRGSLSFDVEVPNSCSRVRLHVTVDGRRRMVTPLFQERSGRIEVGDVGEGSHQLRLQPEGVVGGCNTGTLQSWGGTLTLYVTR
jgi:hypothetical protein